MEKRRRSLRLQDYDYTRPGAYFVTTCTYNRESILGEVEEGKMVLSGPGTIVLDCWNDLLRHYPCVRLGEFVVMPNHIHGIVILTEDDEEGSVDRPAPPVGAGLRVSRSTDALSPMGPDTLNYGVRPRPAPTEEAAHRVSLHEVVRALKSFSAIRINGTRRTRGVPVWQRGYYEHVIRTNDDLYEVLRYIINNPIKWSVDPDNPDTMADDDEHTQPHPARG